MSQWIDEVMTGIKKNGSMQNYFLKTSLLEGWKNVPTTPCGVMRKEIIPVTTICSTNVISVNFSLHFNDIKGECTLLFL